ncbi:MAG TPA: glycosyltransferase [Actinomycetota bacterium]|nr:glycosyltransferase [Actinomycetota bacterium]
MSSTPGYGLFLDIQTTQHLLYNRRGIPRYVANQAKALLKHPGLVRGVYLNPLRPFPDFLDSELLSLETFDWSSMASFRRAADQGPIAYYTMSPFESRRTSEAFLPPFVTRAQVPILVTMYDLIPLLRADKYLGDRNLAREYYGRLDFIKHADLVLTISEHTRRDAIDCLALDPQRVVNIGAGVSDYFRPAAPGDTPARTLAECLPAIRKPFILSVSGAEERKNTEGLIEAFSLLPPALRSELQLVITCKLNDHFTHLWNYKIQQCGLTHDDVVMTDLVADPVLLALYQKAELFVFASFYEGFGLVAAEAAACGCPSLVSNTSSMPEIFNFPPACFDPSDPADIAGHMEAALTDAGFNAELRRVAARTAPVHTWEAVADRTVAALDRLPPPTGIRSRPSPKRKRVALVGPFPPVLSGIADYNGRLAAELSELCDLDLYASVDFDPRATAPGVNSVRRFSIDALGRILNPYAYDAVVYTFGNNQHHHRTYEKALEYPGIVWLHDVQCAGLLTSYAVEKAGPEGAAEFIADLVARLYQQRAPHELLEPRLPSIEEYSRRGVYLTAELVDRARGVIVHSRMAEHLLEIDQGPYGALPPVAVLPLAAGPRLDREHSETPEPLLASFGILAGSKAPGVLLEALARLRRSVPARLAFVGKVDPGFDTAALLEEAERAGVADAVTITGEIPADEYRSWLGRATIAVQLRVRSDGESSAAVADCLAAGVPVVTNLPSCAEMPEGTVRIVPAEITGGILADSLRDLLTGTDKKAALSTAGRRWAAEHSLRRTAEQLLELVDRVGRPATAATFAPDLAGVRR